MVQEFNVLRCFSCQTFQVHQVKKAKKWNCKMCGEKQSFIKVYGQGSGVDCRGHVQKLNSLHGELEEAESAHAWLSWKPEAEEEDLQAEFDEHVICENQQTTGSRWNKYLEKTPEEASGEGAEEESIDHERNAYRTTCPRENINTRKRKRSWGRAPDSGESSSFVHNGADHSRAADPWISARQRGQSEGKHGLHPRSWVPSKMSDDSSVTSRSPPATKASPLSGASSLQAESKSSKWSRFLFVHSDEEEGPEMDYHAGTARGRTGDEKPLGFPSDQKTVLLDRSEDQGNFRARTQVTLPNGVFVGKSMRGPGSENDRLKFSSGIMKAANHTDRQDNSSSGNPVSAVPVCPKTLPSSKPLSSLHCLFQTDEDFDDIF
ncbi:hypothetical protein JZ751_006900 [Albula glossodonta]|uniref:MRN complex-interacting protein N-terminal domain-containing protein n=1 Tax=Albula glossodonta TaxID=121402 RepID=A0A8T2P2P8_9TELE|nr:hypothetical protein JZ751_006900 [Albula glossodonta]